LKKFKVNIAIMIFLVLPVSSAAVENILKFPMNIPISNGSNMYLEFSDSETLGRCLAIKAVQFVKGDVSEEIKSNFTMHYFPLHEKMAKNSAKIGKICGKDDSCLRKHISESDIVYLREFGPLYMRLKSENISSYDLDLRAFAYCGKIVKK